MSFFHLRRGRAGPLALLARWPVGLPNYGPSAGYSVPAIALSGSGGAILGGAMSALGTSSQARKNAKKEAEAARDKEKGGQASTVAKENQSYDGYEIEKMIDSLTWTQKQREQYWRERRYACLPDEAAEDLKVHTVTPSADTTSA